jgi:uncharacterized membrane protein
MLPKKYPVSLMVVSTAINAALYAAIGVISAPIPTVFGVRFWPPVFIPAVFSILFGPWCGGLGAAIGIFFSDVFYGHGNALLSLLVGVPSNFIGFFLIGWLTYRNPGRVARYLLLLISLVVPVLIGTAYFVLQYFQSGGAFTTVQYVYVAVIGVVILVILGFGLLRNKWVDFEIAGSIGLGVGSFIIGLGLVAYSSFFTLPKNLGLGTSALPLEFMYGATAFTFFTEIPFLLFLTPPIVSACRAAFPSLLRPVSSNRSN